MVDPARVELASKAQVTSVRYVAFHLPGGGCRGLWPPSAQPVDLRFLPVHASGRLLRVWITPGRVRPPSDQMPGARDGSGTSTTRRRAPRWRRSCCCWQLGLPRFCRCVTPCATPARVPVPCRNRYGPMVHGGAEAPCGARTRRRVRTEVLHLHHSAFTEMEQGTGLEPAASTLATSCSPN